MIRKHVKISAESLSKLLNDICKELNFFENADGLALGVQMDYSATEDKFCYELRDQQNIVVIPNDDDYPIITPNGSRFKAVYLTAPYTFPKEIHEENDPLGFDLRNIEFIAEGLSLNLYAVEYVWVLLHELGHIYYLNDHEGFFPDMANAISEVIANLNDIVYSCSGDEDGFAQSYRYKYSELLADNFANKYIFRIATKLHDSIKDYFEEDEKYKGLEDPYSE